MKKNIITLSLLFLLIWVNACSPIQNNHATSQVPEAVETQKTITRTPPPTPTIVDLHNLPIPTQNPSALQLANTVNWMNFEIQSDNQPMVSIGFRKDLTNGQEILVGVSSSGVLFEWDLENPTSAPVKTQQLMGDFFQSGYEIKVSVPPYYPSPNTFNTARFSPMGDLFAAEVCHIIQVYDCTVYVWKTIDRTLITTFSNTNAPIEFSPDGKLLAISSGALNNSPGKISLFDLQQSLVLPISEISTKGHPVYIAFHPSGKIIGYLGAAIGLSKLPTESFTISYKASSHKGGTISPFLEIWNLEIPSSPKPLQVIESTAFGPIAFLPNGKTFVFVCKIDPNKKSFDSICQTDITTNDQIVTDLELSLYNIGIARLHFDATGQFAVTEIIGNVGSPASVNFSAWQEYQKNAHILPSCNYVSTDMTFNSEGTWLAYSCSDGKIILIGQGSRP
jgi:WD40 repeat protein